MKVALNIEYFSPHKGGGESYADNFARELVRRGHEVHVFASVFEDVFGKAGSGITFHQVPSIKAVKPLREISFALASARMLKQAHFDIIQGFGRCLYMDVYRPGGGVHREWFKQDLAAIENPLVRTCKAAARHASIRQFIKFGIEHRQYSIPRLSRIIAVSHMVKRHICRHYRVPPEKIAVIYNGVDLQRFNPDNRSAVGGATRKELGISDEIVILFVANNFKLKGLRYLVKAAAEVKRQRAEPFKLVIVGRDRPHPYRSLARELGCEEELIFAGAAADVERYYAAADIFCHPTFYDPCANVCLEALAGGVPTITTRFNGISEIISDGREGFVLDHPADIEAFSRALAHFFDEGRRRQAAEAARRLAEQHTIQRNYHEVIRVYQQVLEERKRTGD